MDEVNKKETEEMQMLYQIFMEDIRHTKNQQWLMVYYGLLLQAAIYKANFWGLCGWKLILSILVLILTTVILLSYKITLDKYGERKEEIIKTLEPRTQGLFNHKKVGDRIENPWIYFVLMVSTQIMAVIYFIISIRY